MMLKLPQVAEGEEAPPPPPPPPPVEEETEKEEPEKELWNAYTTVKGLTISISGLKEGKMYKFRVAAKNIMGMSMFTETREPVEIKEQMCKLFCQNTIGQQFNCLVLSSSLMTQHLLSASLNSVSNSHVPTCSGTKDCHARDSERQSRSQAQSGGSGFRKTFPDLQVAAW